MSVDAVAEETAEPASDPTDAPRRWRRIPALAATAGACLLMLFALVAPNDFNRFSLWAFVRIPVEGLVAVTLVLIVPGRAKRWVSVSLGLVLGLLTLLKIADLGSFAVLYRPFDPVLDWAFVDAGVNYLSVTLGRFGAIAMVVGAVALTIAVPVLMVLSALRLTRIVNAHRTAASRTVKVLAVVWLVFAVLRVPVASTNAAEYAYLHARQVPDGIRDQREFAKEVDADAFRDTPGAQLLTSLRGKDVMLVFVESYGRSAIEHPELAPEVGAVLDTGTQRLRAAGYDSRSGFLTSSTVGGGSWLAHATLVSGLRIDNQQRYRNLVTTDRVTLNRAFQRAGWRTVDVEPALIQAWPEGNFFGYNEIYEASELGYRGPRFSYATMPDQFILSAFHRAERVTPGHAPLMAQITLLSSHAPWSPIPEIIDWARVGDGSIYHSMAAEGAPPEAIFQRASDRVRADYGNSIVYSLNNVISYVEKFGDDDLVLVFLGDHQPSPVVTGPDAGRDVPITIVTRDRAVLDRISAWGWQEGLKPGPQAPVWRMDEFRDQFLTAFG
ncbi:MAG TPA: sulfatase-like hydrolase/transferase [Actinophytocola sp.]|uniref:sulfatase-like hydrolase/transferase n=1 Tax=Actinophytocola sp. TaxID=1872138 RepID=UPI002DDCDAF1|nr:sulfatase-like hydrolase/transferase [Actinophytocola sp.]HEV2781206.1 sulfatase-like hydrolase/transferase [Actinophytocola sp.]